MLKSESRGMRDLTVWCSFKVGLICLCLSDGVPQDGDDVPYTILNLV